MRNSSTVRFISIGLLGIVIGLLAARFPSLDKDAFTFSWQGFFVGLGITIAAFLLSRPFAKKVNEAPPGTPFQRKVLSSVIILFLTSLILFVGLLYSNWLWLKIPLAITVVTGGIGVIVGVISTFFVTPNDA